MTTTNHESAAGAACTEGPDGCCTGCGVSMDVCDTCHGVGYHHAGCAECEELTEDEQREVASAAPNDGRAKTYFRDSFGKPTWEYV